MSYFRYVFIFRSPLYETNLPLAELCAVIRNLVERISIQLTTVHNLLESQNLTRLPAAHARIGILSQSAVILSTIKLPIEQIVAHSGYVHSAGPLVLVKPWAAIDGGQVENSCRQYLQPLGYKSAELIFYNQSEHSEPQDTSELAGLRIDDRRYHLGEHPFRWEAERIMQSLRGEQPQADVVIYGCHDISREIDTSWPIYLKYPDRDLQDYLVLYHTQAKRENPVQRLDDNQENKPYWAGIFTTPHRFVNAMLNLGGLQPGQIVVDPFAYTGTVAIETAKLGGIAYSYDVAEVKGAQDNFEFFCSGKLHEDLDAMSRVPSNRPLLDRLIQFALDHSNLNNLGLPDIKEEDRIEHLVATEEGALLLTLRQNRLVYYMLRRFIMERWRLQGSAKSSPLRPEEAGAYLRDKLGNLRQEANHLAALEAATSLEGDVRLRYVPFGDLTERHCRDFDRPSPRVFSSYVLTDEQRARYTFESRDITTGLPLQPESVDLVVTDPPYGYGDDINRERLRDIYSAFIGEALRALRSGGSLVFCALDKVKTGRPTTNLLTTEEVLGIVNATACQQGLEFAFPSIEPSSGQAHGLFFWKSPKALNRSVFATRVYRVPRTRVAR